MQTAELRAEYDRLIQEATKLAGGLNDLSQRATVYRHIFTDSGHNHIFPLIAAHGALWARGYFRFGLALGNLLSWQFAFRPAYRQRQLAELSEFADTFRDINRRVCIDTYANYHFSKRFGHLSNASQFVPAELLDALNRIHETNRKGCELSDEDRREIFIAHFMHEQQYVVGPTIEAAVNALRWTTVKAIALRPLIRFAYFPTHQLMWFGNFANQEERIAKGLRAFDIAAKVGWRNVESALGDYRVLPTEFFTQPVRHFNTMRECVLSAT